MTFSLRIDLYVHFIKEPIKNKNKSWDLTIATTCFVISACSYWLSLLDPNVYPK